MRRGQRRDRLPARRVVARAPPRLDDVRVGVPAGDVDAVDPVRGVVGFAAAELQRGARGRIERAELEAERGLLVDREAALDHDAGVAEAGRARAVAGHVHHGLADEAHAPVLAERVLQRIRQARATRRFAGRLVDRERAAELAFEPMRRGQCRGRGDGRAVRSRVGTRIGVVGARGARRKENGRTDGRRRDERERRPHLRPAVVRATATRDGASAGEPAPASVAARASTACSRRSRGHPTSWRP